jgi:acyl-CoA synthetase (NDP forming)
MNFKLLNQEAKEELQEVTGRKGNNENLDFIFNPRTVAIIGASSQKGKWGYEIMRNLVEAKFSGKIFPINPKGGEIFNMQAFSSLKDLYEPVDLAIIGIPARHVLGAVKECGEFGVKGVLIVTAGFSEIGSEGKKLQQEIVEEAKKAGVRIIGPNCMGIISASCNLNASVLPNTTGNLALLTQSGNFGVETELRCRRAGLGFSKMVSIGNQADIRFHEYIANIKNDPLTKVIMLFIEALPDGRAFLKETREASRDMPIVALKVGTTEAGTRATMSHTGSLAGMDVIYDAAFKQAGIIRVKSTHDLPDVAEGLSQMPPMNGNRIVVLTDGGGHASAAADIAAENGLVMPQLRKETQKKLKESLLPQSNTANPVDFAGAAESDLWAYKEVMEIILSEKDVDGLLIAGSEFGGYTEMFEQEQLEIDIAQEIVKIYLKFKKPVVLHSPYPREEVKSIKVMRDGGVPCYQRVETAALCLAKHAKYWEHRRKVSKDKKLPTSSKEEIRAVERIISRVKSTQRLNLIESEAMEALAAYKLPVPNAKLVKDRIEAIEFAEELGGRVVIKICSPQIVHKSDARGIKIGLKGAKEVEKACDEILSNAVNYDKSAKIYGLMVSEMLPKGTEIIIGGLRDHQFGPVVMFGLGGIFVEVLKDVSFRVAPLYKREAREMIEEIHGYPILKGIRGESPKDIDAIIDLLMAVSRFIDDHPDISEIDLNPVMVFEKGVTIADAKIILNR